MTTLRKAIWLACVIAAVGADGAALLGQNSGPTTLRVYVNTIQIPVLVLGKNRQPVRPVATNQFLVNFDSGPWFPVTHTRLEGDSSECAELLSNYIRQNPEIWNEDIGEPPSSSCS